MSSIQVETLAGIAELVESRRHELASERLQLNIDLHPRSLQFELLGPRSEFGRRRAQWAIAFEALAEGFDPIGIVRSGLAEMEMHWRSVDK